MENICKGIHILVKVQASCLHLKRISSLIIFEKNSVNLKQFSKIQLHLTFGEQLLFRTDIRYIDDPKSDSYLYSNV